MTSKISIINSALIKIGAERITSLSENSKRAVTAVEQYDKLRDEVLRAHPWNFSIKRAELAALDSTPAFEFNFEYPLPSDCLRPLSLSCPGGTFQIEGHSILTSESTVKVRYISRVTDESLFDAMFAEAFATRLAADLAYPIAQSTQLGVAMLNLYEQRLRSARSADAQEGTPPELTADQWLNSRY